MLRSNAPCSGLQRSARRRGSCKVCLPAWLPPLVSPGSDAVWSPPSKPHIARNTPSPWSWATENTALFPTETVFRPRDDEARPNTKDSRTWQAFANHPQRGGQALNLYGNQLRAAAGVLERFDGVFGSEFTHQQGQLSVGCHLEGSAIDALHIGGAARASPVHFHNELDIFH